MMSNTILAVIIIVIGVFVVLKTSKMLLLEHTILAIVHLVHINDVCQVAARWDWSNCYVLLPGCILWCCYRQRKGRTKSRLLDSNSSTESKNSERSAQLLEKLNKLEMDCSGRQVMPARPVSQPMKGRNLVGQGRDGRLQPVDSVLRESIQGRGELDSLDAQSSIVRLKRIMEA